MQITSSAGDVFIDSNVATVLTAHAFLYGTEISPETIAQVGTVKWYNHDDLTTPIATGLTYTITNDMNIENIKITARLET